MYLYPDAKSIKTFLCVYLLVVRLYLVVVRIVEKLAKFVFHQDYFKVLNNSYKGVLKSYQLTLKSDPSFSAGRMTFQFSFIIQKTYILLII